MSWRAPVEACVHCGLCLPRCPTYVVSKEETDSPRGRIVLLQALLDGEVAPGEVRAPLDRCVGCRACETACPSGVEFGALLEAGRRKLGPARRWIPWLLNGVLARRRLVHALASAGRLARLLPPRGPRRTVPMPAPPPDPRGRVALHLGCATHALFPQLAAEAAQLLTARGWAVEVPRDQGCCGALHRHAGLNDTPQREALDSLAKGYDHVVSVAAGCSATPGITDITVLLQGHEIPARSPAPAPRRVAYDAPCHLLHAQGIDARALLENLPGIELVPLTGADDCCGAGGIYMRVQPRLARDIRAKKLDAIEDAAVDVVATGNPGCLLWLWRGLKERGSRVRVAHPMSLLAELEA